MKDTAASVTSQLDANHPIPSALSERIRQRLEREGIRSCAQWQALGRRRLQIFGLTSARVREIDVAVAQALR
jgi:hypothetical protein